MTAAFAATTPAESFFVELRRASDDRVFRAYRTAPGKPAVTEQTMLQAASTAKWLTASVVLDVVTHPERYPGGPRNLTLDSPVRDFLPAWAPPSTSRLYGVTLRHLLSFTSGLENEDACVSSTTDPAVCVASLVTASLPQNLDADEPRTFFYSGAHLFVAAQVAVAAAGVSDWGTLFRLFKEQHHVFLTPLTSPGPTAFGVGAFFPFSGAGNSPSPAGALRYTAGDYTPFLLELLRGRVLPQAMLDEMLSDQLAKVGATIEYSPLADDGEAWHYGLGTWTECPAPLVSAACVEGRFSSPGSFGTYPFLDLNDGAPYVGLLGYGGTAMGRASVTIDLYRALGGGVPGQKDLAQRWAATTCP